MPPAPAAAANAVQSRRALAPSVFSTTWAYVDHVLVPPGGSTAELAHESVGEAYYVLAGTGTLTVKGQTSDIAAVRTGDAIPIRIGESSQFTNTGSEPLELFVMGVAKTWPRRPAAVWQMRVLGQPRYKPWTREGEQTLAQTRILRSAVIAVASALGFGRFVRPRARRRSTSALREMDFRPGAREGDAGHVSQRVRARGGEARGGTSA